MKRASATALLVELRSLSTPDQLRVGAEHYRRIVALTTGLEDETKLADALGRRLALTFDPEHLGSLIALFGPPGQSDVPLVPTRSDRKNATELSNFPLSIAAGTLLRPELRASLASRLPSYMLPTAFVFPAALPLTPNGKVDRKALPEPARSRAEDSQRIAPRTPLEKELLEIWTEVLGIDAISVFDNFFELGGHSLVGARLVARVRQALGIELPLRALFEAPSIAEFAERVLGEQLATLDEETLVSLVRADEESLDVRAGD